MLFFLHTRCLAGFTRYISVAVRKNVAHRPVAIYPNGKMPDAFPAFPICSDSSAAGLVPGPGIFLYPILSSFESGGSAVRTGLRPSIKGCNIGKIPLVPLRLKLLDLVRPGGRQVLNFTNILPQIVKPCCGHPLAAFPGPAFDV